MKKGTHTQVPVPMTNSDFAGQRQHKAPVMLDGVRGYWAGTTRNCTCSGGDSSDGGRDGEISPNDY